MMHLDNMKKSGIVTASEYSLIAAYIDYTDAIVYEDNGKFYISIPQETITYNTKQELLSDVRFNMECIKDMYSDREADGKSSDY